MAQLKRREHAALAFTVWIVVYPSVLAANYVLRWLSLTELPLPVSVFLTTIFTVPLLSIVVIPKLKGALAKAEACLGVSGGLREEEDAE